MLDQSSSGKKFNSKAEEAQQLYHLAIRWWKDGPESRPVPAQHPSPPGYSIRLQSSIVNYVSLYVQI
jgi:hypothetical protein